MVSKDIAESQKSFRVTRLIATLVGSFFEFFFPLDFDLLTSAANPETLQTCLSNYISKNLSFVQS